MRTPATTLLILDATRVIRADFGASGSREPARVFTQPVFGAPALVESVRAALALAPKCGKNVWVAADDIWAQQLTLPAAAVAGLKDVELSGALAFEAEPLSGIPSYSAAMGFLAVQPPRKDGLIDFAAISTDATVRDEIQALVKAARGKLRGLCAFKDLPRLGDAKNEQDWIEACACDLQSAVRRLPVIPPAPEKVSPLRYWAFGLALEAAVLAICFAHAKFIERDLNSVSAMLQTARDRRKPFEELKVKNEAAKTELKKIEAENARTFGLSNAVANEVAYQRARIPAILRGLSRQLPRDVALLSISAPDPQQLVVEALSLDPAHADTYAAQLETALAQAGMQVQPQGKTAQNLTANGGPWKFTLQIGRASDTLAPASASASKGTPAALTTRRH